MLKDERLTRALHFNSTIHVSRKVVRALSAPESNLLHVYPWNRLSPSSWSLDRKMCNSLPTESSRWNHLLGSRCDGMSKRRIIRAVILVTDESDEISVPVKIVRIGGVF